MGVKIRSGEVSNLPKLINVPPVYLGYRAHNATEGIFSRLAGSHYVAEFHFQFFHFISFKKFFREGNPSAKMLGFKGPLQLKYKYIVENSIFGLSYYS